MGKRDQPASRGRCPGTTVCVSGISADIKKVALQEKFGDFGRIVRIEVPPGKAIAFVEFEETEDAAKAKLQCDGTMIDRHRIVCKVADGRAERPDFRSREPLGGSGLYPDRIGRGFKAEKRYIEELSSKSSLRSTTAAPFSEEKKDNGRKSRSPVRKGRSASRSPRRNDRSRQRAGKRERSRSHDHSRDRQIRHGVTSGKSDRGVRSRSRDARNPNRSSHSHRTGIPRQGTRQDAAEKQETRKDIGRDKVKLKPRVQCIGNESDDDIDSNVPLQ